MGPTNYLSIEARKTTQGNATHSAENFEVLSFVRRVDNHMVNIKEKFRNCSGIRRNHKFSISS